MEGLLGATLLKGSSSVATSSALPAGGVVGLYFSAHWCGPCREYTPQLREVYNRAQKKGKAFNIVFVSSDRDEASFKEYFGTMPWHGVPYADRLRQQSLSAAFQVQGIPALVLLGPGGTVLEANARARAMEPSFLASLPRAADLAAALLPQPTGPVELLLRCRGKEFMVDCEPEEGWELLRLQIFSVTEVPVEQQRLFGLGVEVGPLDEKVPLPHAVARGLAARKSSFKVADVPDAARTASSVHADDPQGQGHHTGRLSSNQAWSAKAEDSSPWYQMDLGSVQRVSGVMVAARADSAQWVTRFKVALAEQEAGPFAPVDGGKVFEGPSMVMEHPVQALFSSPATTRYVRILPTGHHKHCSLRADVLLATSEAALQPPVLVVLGNMSADDPFDVTQAGTSQADKLMEEQHLALLQAKLSSLPQGLQQLVNTLSTVGRYEDLTLQRQALDDIPVLEMDRRCTGEESYEMAFMRQLLRWFKHDFFTWTNTPRCQHCSSENTTAAGGTPPTPIEQHFGAGRVEVATCNVCGLQTRFPRYNDPSKLLETRTGRCGEWANCFTLVCRALGYEARYIHDYTDHVWTEVYSDSLQRWVHADSCEAALDTPLVYEQGWGKKLTYCLGFARDHAVDVTRRYTRKFTSEVISRRTNFSEQHLQRAMTAIGDFALDRSLLKMVPAAASQRRAAVEKRAEWEAREFEGEIRPVKPKVEEQVGRTSGDAEWRAQRGELGTTTEARAQALERSEKGLDSTPAKVETPVTAPSQASPPEDPQAKFRARFAELVASGMAPNEAALKLLAEAK